MEPTAYPIVMPDVVGGFMGEELLALSYQLSAPSCATEKVAGHGEDLARSHPQIGAWELKAES
jgi:hypothetical protein